MKKCKSIKLIGRVVTQVRKKEIKPYVYRKTKKINKRERKEMICNTIRKQ
jgi:hypothetical protein